MLMKDVSLKQRIPYIIRISNFGAFSAGKKCAIHMGKIINTVIVIIIIIIKIIIIIMIILKSRGFLKHFVIKTIGMRKRRFDRSTVIIKQSEDKNFHKY